MSFRKAIVFLKEETINGDVAILKITLDHSYLAYELEVDADALIDFLTAQSQEQGGASNGPVKE